jgi:hypothetical protein
VISPRRHGALATEITEKRKSEHEEWIEGRGNLPILHTLLPLFSVLSSYLRVSVVNPSAK